MLETPDQRALHYGIGRTELPARIQAWSDAIVFEHNRLDEGATGDCMDYVMRHDGETSRSRNDEILKGFVLVSHPCPSPPHKSSAAS